MEQFKKDKFQVYESIYEIVKCIPFGRVSTYGTIASSIGLASGARLVGYALKHSIEAVPAHRVVNATGLLTGRHHFSPPELMQQKLEAEGVTIKNNQVQYLKSLLWDPAIEMNNMY
jgi:methylated-DNA-protein-cysteine methyltransferase-like protein